MLFVRNVFLVVAFLSAFAFCDVENLFSRIAYGENPGVRTNSFFGGSYWQRNTETDERHFLAEGQFGNENYGIFFSQSYSEWDSLYYESFSKISGSFSWKFVTLGTGYGLNVNWLSTSEEWVLHWSTVGTSLYWNSLQLGFWTQGFVGEPWKILGNINWNPTDHFLSSVTTDWSSVDIGTGLCFEYGCVKTSYRFPGFSFSVELSIHLGSVKIGGNHGFFGGTMDLNGLWAKKMLF